MLDRKITVYIVEDYLLTRMTYKNILEKSNLVEVLGDFDSAEKMLEAMKVQVADIILMDLGLPYMNGIEATEVLKKQFPTTKIIILTSHEHQHEVLACVAFGAEAYVLKDTPSEVLLNVMEAVYNGAIWIEPKLSDIFKSLVPKPCSTDFDNLYTDTSIEPLTEREKVVLRLMTAGKTNPEIAKEVIISVNTAKAHVTKILEKLSVRDRVQAVVKAIKYNLL